MQRFRNILIGLLAACVASNALASNAEKLNNYVSAVVGTLGADERQALHKIPDDDRHLLAMRAYVRAGANVRARWSWTDAQIRAYARSPQHEQLIEDIEAVKRTFEQQNPGYTLYANSEVRSLDTQLERWNTNAGVGSTARALREAALHAVAQSPHEPTAASLLQFKAFLRTWRPSPAAPLAAPGLSMHGQSSAIDFQIMRNNRIVAATEVGAVSRDWEATGWTGKLKRAVTTSGGRFKGPLQSPNEPWHYEYLGRPELEGAGISRKSSVLGAVREGARRT